MMRPEQYSPDDLRVILANARDGALELVDSVVKLAQIEVRRDAKQAIRLAVQAIVSVSLALAGYCFVIVGTVWALSSWLPAWVALLALGVIHLVAGALGATRLKQRAQSFQPMQLTAVELTKAVASLRGSFPESSSTSMVALKHPGGHQPLTRT